MEWLMRKGLKFGFLVCCLFALAACGGGGSSSNAADASFSVTATGR
jgi:ABC-type glycerol-3-phosphate transport system substrate-binding protein